MSAPVHSLRWTILALVFVASALNYADRQLIALLKPLIEQDLGWSQRDYAHLVNVFQLATALSLIAAGWFVDRVGVRWAYGAGVSVWSLAAMVHGAAYTIAQFTWARIVLGVAETVNTPAALKTVATWFPLKERSLALGISNSAGNIGAIVVPLTAPLLGVLFGWRMAFVIVGAVGFVWLAVWLVIIARTRQVAGWARPEPPAAQPTLDAKPASGLGDWLRLLRDRRTIAVLGAKAFMDQGWWFLLFWAPDFFTRVFGLKPVQLGPPLALVYGLAAAGSMLGGFAATRLLARGASLGRARKGVMLVAALVVVPVPVVLLTQQYWVAALILGIALAAHQAFSTNLFALVTDVFPTRVIGSVIGLAATAGTLAGMGILEFTGWTLDRGGSYLPMFAVVSVAYLLALGWIQLFIPKLTPHAEHA